MKFFGLFIIGIMILGVTAILATYDNNSNEIDYCSDKELFGLKYTNCDSLECINFYESTKESLRQEHCE